MVKVQQISEKKRVQLAQYYLSAGISGLRIAAILQLPLSVIKGLAKDNKPVQEVQPDPVEEAVKKPSLYSPWEITILSNLGFTCSPEEKKLVHLVKVLFPGSVVVNGWKNG